MQIIIDIDDDIAQGIIEGNNDEPRNIVRSFQATIADAIKNGTPLPQPLDLEGLKSDMKALNCGYPYGLDYLLDCLNRRLGITIIEADKE